MTDVAPTVKDRLWRSFRALVAAELPFLKYYMQWSFVVQATDGATADVSPETSDVPFDAIPGCPLSPSLACENVTMEIGSRVRVRFVNGDPSRPEICAGDYDGTPTQIKFAGGGAASARVGDDVNAGYLVLTAGGTVSAYFAGTTAGLAAATAAAVAIGGSVISMTSGRITSGSAIVEVG